MSEHTAESVARPVSADYAAGLRFAADVVHAEARWQTELAMRAAPGMLAEHDYAAARASNVEAAIRALAECVTPPAEPTPPTEPRA